MSISFIKFLRMGSDQWRVQSNPFASIFLRTIGTLDIHARIRNARILNALNNLDLNHRRVLDLGSGRGYLLFYLAHQYPAGKFEGIELDPRRVDECQRIAREAGLDNLKFQQGSYQRLKDESMYDLVISIDVLEHVPNDMDMLRKIAHILQPGGKMAIHVPLRHQLQRRVFAVFKHHTIDDHVRDEYLPSEITDKVTAAGLEIDQIEFGFGFLGEFSFELNNLFWDRKIPRIMAAVITLPISMITGYIDTNMHHLQGNSIAIVARRPYETINQHV